MAHDVDTELIRITGQVARIKFDGENERKLKPLHGNIRKAIAACSRELGRPVSINEMATDWFNGHPFLVWALLIPSLKANQRLSVDDASNLIDTFLEKGGTSQELQNALVVVLATYLRVEVQKQDDEEDDKDDPNAPTPEQPGRTDD
jgi:hypothetical protein